MRERFEIAPGEEGFLRRHGLVSVNAVFRVGEGQRLDKPGLEDWRQRWRLELEDDAGARRVVYLKRFECPPFKRQWQRWREGHVGLSTAGVEWSNAQRLAQKGVPAVRAIAFGQQMQGAWERRSFVLLAEVKGEALERWLPRVTLTAGQRRRLVEGAAELVARLHGAGVVHRDLYLSHIFHDGESLRLIDLQRAFRPRWRRGRWVIKDLAALHYSTPADKISRRDRLRFLSRYGRGRGVDVRELARRVEAKARWMARRRPEWAVGLEA